MAPCVCNVVYQSIKRVLPRHRESNLTRCRKFVLLYVRVTSSARSRSCFFCMEHVRRVHPAGTAGAILPPYSTRIPMGMYLYTWYGAVAVGTVYSLSSGTRCAGLFTAGRRDFICYPEPREPRGVRGLQPPLHHLYAAPAFQLRYETEEEIGTRRRTSSFLPPQ